MIEPKRSRRSAEKRGAGVRPVVLDEALAPARSANPVDLVALDDLLERLTALNERHARVVELRFFGGMTVKETAHALEVSEYYPNIVWMQRLDLRQHGRNLSAIGSLEVGVNKDRYFSIIRSAAPIIRRNWG